MKLNTTKCQICKQQAKKEISSGEHFNSKCNHREEENREK